MYVCMYVFIQYFDDDGELINAGSGRWDDRKELGWKERMDEWKVHQGNLGTEYDDLADPDMGM